MTAHLVSSGAIRYPIRWEGTPAPATNTNWLIARNGPHSGTLWERIAEGKTR